MSTLETDMVNSPPHYRVGGMECIQVIEDYRLGPHLASALKYIWRAGRKTPDVLVDLRKAVWYCRRAVDRNVDLVFGSPKPSRALPFDIAEELGLSVTLTRALAAILTPSPQWQDIALAVEHLTDEIMARDGGAA